MTTRERRVRIVQDSDPESPREGDNMGHMVCFHRRYNLGDETYNGSRDEWRMELAESLVGGFKTHRNNIPDSDIEKAVDAHMCVLLPLYLYDHSGLAISTGSFVCRWDSGQVGYIYCTWEKARKEFPPDLCGDLTDYEIRDRVERNLLAEVKTYDQYLQNDVWGYVVEERDPVCPCCHRVGDWETVDSCWGFYGDDPETNGMRDCVKKDDVFIRP